MKWVKRTPCKRHSSKEDIIIQLAKIHGVDNNIDEFLNPTVKSLHSPYLLLNIDTVRNKILEAIAHNKKIAIFADVDADGVTSCAEMYNFLINFTDNVVIFHAQRSMGHGIEVAVHHDSLPENENNKMIPEDIDLLIIVDSSTSDTEACKELSEKGIDIIIIDHHPSEQENPYATIVNNQMSPDYPNKELSGAGMVWKVCQVIDDTLGTDYSVDLVDLAGVGIHSDTMSMKEYENRYIVSEALKNIKNLGLKQLLLDRRKDLYNLNSNSIGYDITPIINASSRMDKIEVALKLLTCQDIVEVKALAKEMKKLNEKRKELQVELFAKFSPQVNESDNLIVIIDEKDEIGKGFGGLIAQDLVQLFQRNVCVLAPSDGLYKGSFRSVAGFDLKNFFGTLPQVNFTAGHQGAGGVSVPIELIDDFKKSANEALSGDVKEKALVYDMEISVHQLDLDTMKRIEEFTKINGKDIKEIKFLIPDLFIVDKELIGKTVKETMKAHVDSDFAIMKFKTNDEYFEQFPIFSEIKAIGTLNINKFYNFRSKELIITRQIFLEDYKLA